MLPQLRAYSPSAARYTLFKLWTSEAELGHWSVCRRLELEELREAASGWKLPCFPHQG
jgi:hypothetical protein